MPRPRGCAVCDRALVPGRAFQLQTPQGQSVLCLRCALRHRPMLRRSSAVALLVGTILTAINQGDLLLHGTWEPALIWKIPLTYLVPFLVATWGALTGNRLAAARSERDGV